MGTMEMLLQQIGDELSPESQQNPTPESRIVRAEQFREEVASRPEYKFLTPAEKQIVYGILDSVKEEIDGVLAGAHG